MRGRSAPAPLAAGALASLLALTACGAPEDGCDVRAASSPAADGATIDVPFEFPLTGTRVELYPIGSSYVDFDGRLWAVDEASVSHTPAEVRAALGLPGAVDSANVSTQDTITLVRSGDSLVGTIGSSGLTVRLTTSGVGCA